MKWAIYLKNVIESVRETNVSEEDEMKQIMQVYSKHRQVSAQESCGTNMQLTVEEVFTKCCVSTDG